MNILTKTAVFLSMAAAGLILAACSAEEGTTTPTPTPTPAITPTPTPIPASATAEGLWKGVDSGGRSFTALVLGDGTGKYWMPYTTAANPNVFVGFLTGTATSLNTLFSSTNGVNFDSVAANIGNVVVSGSYIAKSTFRPQITGNNQIVSLNSTYSPDYELTPTLASIAGEYTGQVSTLIGTQNSTLTVTNTGTVSGKFADGCQFSGNISANAKGNLYNLSLAYIALNCGKNTGSVAGVAYYDKTQRTLVVTTIDTPRTAGLLFQGTKL
ncbi:hypothetical protein IGB42_01947 [Andreprevotia sp. IGB-42]|uniref:hypothetical protein n=1 Tax=Andreprevotia sp. IGB-42 TaxID=2497473 RepID=UPI001356E436|nr:hypothetical protein [Andreprevotia sp. IGB-42]KAF0813596.1 hypothetical protein IGB42_01947 [Andreprevotia sp. IGB-42]